jgi:hypothetical protein
MKLIAVTSDDNYTDSFIVLVVNLYNNRLLPLLRQFLLIAKGMNVIMDLRP